MNPADNVIKRAVASLVPYARNSRTHSDEQVSQIMASIREWGWTTPVLITEDGMIVAGHGRVLAAQRLGLEEVPCVVASGWTEAQIRAYVIADNKLALNAGWDSELLKAEVEDLKASDFLIDLLGFKDWEIEHLLNPAAEWQDDVDAIDDLDETDEEGSATIRVKCLAADKNSVIDLIKNALRDSDMDGTVEVG